MSILDKEFGMEFRPFLQKTGKMFIDRKEGFIYHYTSSEGLLGILRDKTLWFTDTMGLNDSSEGNYIWEILEECLEGNYDEKFNTSIKALEKDSYEIDDDMKGTFEPHSYFICSFSENQDSLQMWNYYTKNINSVGYNICFDRQHLIKSVKEWDKNFEVTLCQVIYDKEKQKEWMKSALDLIYKYWKKHKKNYRLELLSCLQYLFARVRIVFKHPSFANEQEVRLVVELAGSQFFDNLTTMPKQKEVKIRIVNNMFVPYLEVPFKEPSIIKQITTSPIIKDDTIVDSVYLLLYKYGEIDSCEIKRSEIPLKY